MYANAQDVFRRTLDEIRAAGTWKEERLIASPQGAEIRVGGRTVLNFCANNYLGLSGHPDLLAAARAALEDRGYGLSSVRFICGTQDRHRELERRLAAFFGFEDAILFSSCFDANGGVFEALLGEEDAIVSDALNHASIIDGIRLSKARRYRYAHADLGELEARLREAASARLRLVVTDGVFSMDGDLAPLDALTPVAELHEAMLMVDDAHGEGVLGRGGRGIVDHFGLHGRVDVEVGTLSKAFGVMGGYVAGSATLIEWLHQRARPFLFSSAATPADVAACLAAVDLLEASTELVDRLWQNARYFQAEMKRLGFDTGATATPITPVMLGEAPLAQQFSRKLFEHGTFAMAIGFPTVPKGKARLRVMLSAAHTPADLAQGLEAFAKVGKELGVLR